MKFYTKKKRNNEADEGKSGGKKYTYTNIFEINLPLETGYIRLM